MSDNILQPNHYRDADRMMKTVIGSICKYKNSSFPKLNW
jgi:hypothetical protein